MTDVDVASQAPDGSSPAEGSAPSEGSAAAVFRNRPFLLLWLSQLATQVGGNMVLYGLTILVYGSTGSSSAVSLLILTYLLPAVLFSAFAGVYVDRFDRRIVLVVTNLLRFGFFLALALLAANVLVIFLLNVAVSIATTFFAPAELSMIPIVVPRQQRTAANGIFTLTLNAAFAIGFAVLGPLVVSIANPTALVLVVAALYLVAAIFCWTLPPAPPEVAPQDATLHEAEAAVVSFVEQFREGVAYVRANPIVRWALLYQFIAASIVGVLGVLGTKFAVDVLGLRAQDFVVIVLPLGVGVVTGALAVNAVQGMISRRRLIETGLIVLGICIAMIAVAGPIAGFLRDVNDAVPGPDMSAFVSVLTVVVAVAFVAGISYAAVAIPAQTALQAEIPQEVRGRVFGILNMLVSIGSLLPIIIVGLISDTGIGPTPVLLFAASAILLVGILSVTRRSNADFAPVSAHFGPVEADPWEVPDATDAPLDARSAPGPSPDEP